MNTNDNTPDVVVPFVPKKMSTDSGSTLVVYVRDGLIGIELEDGVIALDAKAALKFSIILLSAMNVQAELTTEET